MLEKKPIIVVKKPLLDKAIVIEARSQGQILNESILNEQKKLLDKKFENWRLFFVDDDIDFPDANDIIQQLIAEKVKNIVFYYTPPPLFAHALIERWGLLGRVDGIQSLAHNSEELEKAEKIGEEALNVWILWNGKREISFSKTDHGIIEKIVTPKEGWELIKL